MYIWESAVQRWYFKPWAQGVCEKGAEDRALGICTIEGLMEEENQQVRQKKNSQESKKLKLIK